MFGLLWAFSASTFPVSSLEVHPDDGLTNSTFSGGASKRGRWRTLLPGLILLVEVILFFRRVVFSEQFVLPWDFRYVHLPLAEFFAESLRHGHWPLWDPFTYCGRPFFANIQASSFYPPFVVTAVTSNLFGGDHLTLWLEWMVALHVWFAGLCTYALLRDSTTTRAKSSAESLSEGPPISVPSALLGATAFQLGGFFASQEQHMGAMCGAAWLPLAWWCVVRLSRKNGGLPRWRWTAVLAVALGMSVLAGLPQVAVAVFGSTLLLAICLSLAFRQWKTAAGVLIASAWGIAIAAIQFVPTAQLTGLSVAKYRTDWLQSGGGLKLGSIISLFVPNYFQVFDLSRFRGPGDPTFLYLYIGGLPLALAGIALIRISRPGISGLTAIWARVLAAMTGVCGLWMLGDSTGAGRNAMALLPSSIRIGVHPEFAMCAFVLGLALLSGVGAEYLKQFSRNQAWLIWGVVVVAAVDLISVSSARPMNMASVNEEPGITREAFDGNVEVLRELRKMTGQENGPDGDKFARIDSVDGSLNWAQAAPLTRVPTANGCDPLALERSIQMRLAFCEGKRWGWYYQVTSLRSPVLGLAGIRWLLSAKKLGDAPLAGSPFVFKRELPGNFVYENKAVLPRFFLVTRVRYAESLEEAAKVFRKPDFDPSREVIVEDGERRAVHTQAADAGTVRVIRYRPTDMEFETNTRETSFLVVAETNYPGWRAWVDGVETPVLNGDVAFRVLRVRAGNHQVRFKFHPWILLWGGLLSAGGLFLACWMVKIDKK